MKSLVNKIALITGAASGVGNKTASDYLAETDGRIKLILVDINIEALEKQRIEYLKTYTNLSESDIYVTYGNLSKTELIHDFFNKIPRELIENLDILINSAGLARGLDRVGNVKQQDIDMMYATNILGLMTLTQLVVPIFQKLNKGDIVNIGSLAAEDPYPGGAAYCSSKAAVKTYTTSLRKEMINYDIRVVLIEPGLINTNFSLTRFSGDKSKADKVYSDYEPLSPSDISSLIIYVTSRPAHCAVSEVVILPTRQATMSDKAYR
jgi:3-hydroxy acid dehydrogenase/malonic semialdehyde reductase